MRALTDTERLDALFTLFGGHYAFSPFLRIQEHFQDGRRGLDKFIADNPSLLGISAPENQPAPRSDFQAVKQIMGK